MDKNLENTTNSTNGELESVIAEEEKMFKFEQGVKAEFTKIHNLGLLRGSKAMCAVMLEKAKDETKTIEEKLQDIIEFCERSLGIKEENIKENN